jgi:hypothetical protein
MFQVSPQDQAEAGGAMFLTLPLRAISCERELDECSPFANSLFALSYDRSSSLIQRFI